VDGYYYWVKQFFDAYAKTDIPVMMVHDDMVWTSGPFTSPEWYRKNIFPKIKKLIAPVKEAGKKIIFTSDGTYTEFFDDVVDCGADMLVMEPTSDMELFAKKYGKTHGFVGNADCRILLDGSKEDIHREVERCMNIGRDCPGFIMAVGNHIPPNTPVDNALYYNEIYEKMSIR
jgi:uroporphyrinogen-III decarboxylase